MKNKTLLLRVIFILLGLSELSQAHYSPELGRFLSRDPIEERGGANLHSFVGNNSIKHSDELGLKISVGNTEYWEMSRIYAFSSKLALTIDANSASPGPLTEPKVRGDVEFDWKIGYGKCCIKLKKAPELYGRIKVILPSDWGDPILLANGNYISMTQTGYRATIAHEFRRRNAYLEASKVFLEPVELEGSKITECGWYCADSASKLNEYKQKLEKHLLRLQTQAKREYKHFLFGEGGRGQGVQGGITNEAQTGFNKTYNGQSWGVLTGMEAFIHVGATVSWNSKCPEK